MGDSVITLTTDFGDAAPYVAAMKGVILSLDARARLLREYPNSGEATRAALPEREAPPIPAEGSVTVEIGSFSSPGRAHSLLAAAQRAGFTEAKVVLRGEGRARSYLVLLGTYLNAEAGRRAGESAARRLGVSYQLGSPP